MNCRVLSTSIVLLTDFLLTLQRICPLPLSPPLDGIFRQPFTMYSLPRRRRETHSFLHYFFFISTKTFEIESHMVVSAECEDHFPYISTPSVETKIYLCSSWSKLMNSIMSRLNTCSLRSLFYLRFVAFSFTCAAFWSLSRTTQTNNKSHAYRYDTMTFKSIKIYLHCSRTTCSRFVRDPRDRDDLYPSLFLSLPRLGQTLFSCLLVSRTPHHTFMHFYVARLSSLTVHCVRNRIRYVFFFKSNRRTHRTDPRPMWKIRNSIAK